MPGGVRELVEGGTGGGRLGENPWSLKNSTWDVGQLALLRRPSGSSSVRWTPHPGLFPLGAGTQGGKGKADCGLSGPSFCSTCISGEMVCTSEPCPGIPMLGAQESAVGGGLGDGGPFSNQPGGVRGAPRKLGSREDLTCLSHPVPFSCTRHGSGLWLEPLDPVESLQPQL